MSDMVDPAQATAKLIEMGGTITAMTLFVWFLVRQNKYWQDQYTDILKGYQSDSKASTAAITASTAAVNNNTSAIEKLTDECRRKS